MESALLPLLLIAVLAIPLIMGSRRQKKMAAQQQELQNSLTVGDRVMTTSGLYGTVSDISDDASIGIEIAPGVETTWLRQAVREKVGPDVTDDDVIDDDEDETTTENTVDSENTTGSTAEVAEPIESDKRT